MRDSLIMEAKLIDVMGSDLTVVNAARVSFNKTKEVMDSGDEKLIKYLAKHKHWTPFGHVQLQFRIAAPVFVARQMVKHQVGLVWNEISRRYVDSEVTFYEPRGWRKAAENKKQGSSDDYIEHNLTTGYSYNRLMRKTKEFYEDLLKSGVAPEQARMVLPQSMITEWIWTGSLAAFARVVSLRSSPDAQKECAFLSDLIDIEISKNKDLQISWKNLKEQ